MGNKEAVIELVNRLPENVSLREIAQEIEFVAAIQEGLEQIDQGQGVPLEDVEKMIDLWTTK
jgi:predicted transcriptional regulator